MKNPLISRTFGTLVAIAIMLVPAALVICAGMWAFVAWKTLPIINRANTASAILLDCKGHAACLESSVLAITGSVKAASGAVAKAAPEVAASLKDASSNSAQASKATVRLVNDGDGLVLSARDAVDESKMILVDLRKDISDADILTQDLLRSGDITVKEASVSLEKLGALEVDLQKQIDAGAPEALETLEAMRALVSDPALTRALDNIDAGTLHLASTAETMDLATIGLRQKVGRIKFLLGKLFEMAEHAIPLL